MALMQTFKAKIVTLIALAVAGMLLLATLSFWQIRTLMLDGRKAQLTAAVQSARSIVDGYQKKAAGGAMSVAEAQSAAREALRAARYGDGGSDYFYIWTLDGVSVMLPSKPEWAGQNMIGKVKDAAGTDVIRSMTSAAKASETGWAFVLTQFPHPGGTEPAPKLQLVTVVREWNWMVGSGLYMDEAEAPVHATLFKMAGFALAMILALGAVGAWVAKVVLRQLGGEPAHAVAMMRRLAQGDLRTGPMAAPEGSLLFELQRTIVSVRATVCGVRDSIDSITTASAKIAAGGLDLSRRTEQAAANLQQTAATMEQLTGTVSAEARSAREAGQLAD